MPIELDTTRLSLSCPARILLTVSCLVCSLLVFSYPAVPFLDNGHFHSVVILVLAWTLATGCRWPRWPGKSERNWQPMGTIASKISVTPAWRGHMCVVNAPPCWCPGRSGRSTGACRPSIKRTWVLTTDIQSDRCNAYCGSNNTCTLDALCVILNSFCVRYLLHTGATVNRISNYKLQQLSTYCIFCQRGNKYSCFEWTPTASCSNSPCDNNTRGSVCLYVCVLQLPCYFRYE